MHSLTSSNALLSLAALAMLSACPGSSVPDEEVGQVVGLRAYLVSDTDDLVSNELEIDLVNGIAATADSRGSGETSMTSPNARVVKPLPGLGSASTFDSLLVGTSRALPEVGNAACFDQPKMLRTFPGNDSICWQAVTTSVSQISTGDALVNIYFMTPDGIYHGIVRSQYLSSSASFASAGTSFGTGCVASPTKGEVSVEYLESLMGIGLSSSVGISSVGITIFQNDEGIQRSFQYDTGISISWSIFPFINFELTLDIESGFVIPPTRLTGNSCSGASLLADNSSPFADRDGNPFEIIALGLAELSQAEGSSYRDLMLGELASAARPTFDLLADRTGSQPEEGVPAANHADLSNAFFARSGSALCKDCPDTSIDGFLYEVQEGANQDATADIRESVTGAFGQYQSSAPDIVRLSITQRRSGGSAVTFAQLAHEDMAAEARGDADRHVAAEIIEIDAMVGQPVAVIISAEEIADLLGVSASDVEGASVTIDATPYIEAASFVLENGKVAVEIVPKSSDALVLRIDVDLSSAAGNFGSDTSSWVVRPALRRIRPRSGPPALVSLSAPLRVKRNTETVLSAMVTDKDYAPVDGEYAVRFFDGEMNLLGEAPLQGGIAQLTVALMPSTPSLDKVEATQIRFPDDSVGPGYEIVGEELSQNAAIFIDGTRMARESFASSNVSSREIIFALDGSGLGPGPHSLFVQNPDGRNSDELSFSIP